MGNPVSTYFQGVATAQQALAALIAAVITFAMHGAIVQNGEKVALAVRQSGNPQMAMAAMAAPAKQSVSIWEVLGRLPQILAAIGLLVFHWEMLRPALKDMPEAQAVSADIDALRALVQ